jgi:hypothetical protein
MVSLPSTVDPSDGGPVVSVLQRFQSAQAGDGRLRVVFADSVVSRNFAPEVTLSDIAREVKDLSRRRHREPVAIHVTLSAPLISTHSLKSIRYSAQ